MKDFAKVLYEFWNSFGINAYPTNSVPDNAELPYITYEISKPDWSDQVPISASVWYRDTSYIAISEKVHEIEKKIGGGISIPVSNGCVVLYKETNFIQIQDYAEDRDLKVAYLSMIVNAFID